MIGMIDGAAVRFERDAHSEGAPEPSGASLSPYAFCRELL
jgi:hypothetical protein